jgi:hypothetical protein
LNEDILQAEIYKWFHNTHCAGKNNIIFSVPNGGTRNTKEAMKLKATGLMPGVSDLIILLPSKCLFIEVKTSTGKQSDAQKVFSSKVTSLGFDYHLVRSFEDFKSIILPLLL